MNNPVLATGMRSQLERNDSKLSEIVLMYIIYNIKQYVTP